MPPPRRCGACAPSSSTRWCRCQCCSVRSGRTASPSSASSPACCCPPTAQPAPRSAPPCPFPSPP
eukprot:1187592-Prorocentrum_minimum.AAC.2